MISVRDRDPTAEEAVRRPRHPPHPHHCGRAVVRCPRSPGALCRPVVRHPRQRGRDGDPAYPAGASQGRSLVERWRVQLRRSRGGGEVVRLRTSLVRRPRAGGLRSRAVRHRHAWTSGCDRGRGCLCRCDRACHKQRGPARRRLADRHRGHPRPLPPGRSLRRHRGRPHSSAPIPPR